MSDITFVRRHDLPLANARALVQKIADDLGAEHHLKSEWHANTLRFERTGIHGQMHVAPSKVRLDVNLGFLFKPLKAALVHRIEQEFDKYIPESRVQNNAKKPARNAAHTVG